MALLFIIAVTSLHQDMIGKDAYIARVQTEWVDSSISVPIALLLLIVVFILPAKREKTNNHETH